MVFGPAYLDRVLRVDRPLTERTRGPAIDQSVQGDAGFTRGETLALLDERGFHLEIEPPPGWQGPTGRIKIRGLSGSTAHERRAVRGLSWSDDLGGMGAGFALALNGTLISALGPQEDPISRKIVALLEQNGISHHAVRVPDALRRLDAAGDQR